MAYEGRKLTAAERNFSGEVGALQLGSAHRENTDANAELANDVIRVENTLRPLTISSNDDWDRQPPVVLFAIRVNSAASILGDGPTPFLTNRPRILACRCLPRPLTKPAG